MAIKRRPRKTAMNATPRIRFNWGFWDAMNDRFGTGRGCKDEVWISRHFDKVYAAGYSAGKQWDCGLIKPESSDPAWIEFSKESK